MNNNSSNNNYNNNNENNEEICRIEKCKNEINFIPKEFETKNQNAISLYQCIEEFSIKERFTE